MNLDKLIIEFYEACLMKMLKALARISHEAGRRGR